eukprot:GFUD01032401.1.p1 GENE.GFUD01032401.1~~GFUD01032401.1.p1  ORF type:complete len:413 (+),score=148.52 GFUD01032401.1:168-1406(+)
MQSSRGKGRSGHRGGGVAAKYTDSTRHVQGADRTRVGRGVAAKYTDSTRVESRQVNVQGCTDSDCSAGTVVGRCTDFCPASELKLRVRERLLHRYEGGGGSQDTLRPVKEYSRPAAGQAPPSSDTVRTPDTLLDCVRYLVREVLGPRLGVKEGHLELYDFVFDRLRAVRQDLVVQGVKDTTSETILSVCVRFHLLFGHLLAHHPSFSTNINTSHQLECVKSCLLLSSATSHNHMMEAVYILSNMDSPSAISWAIMQPKHSPKLQLCLAISQAYDQGNSVRFYRLVSTLPLLLLLASAKYCQLMCDHALSVYSKGYRAKNARYPVSHLATLLWLSPSSLSHMLSSKGILVKEGSVWWADKASQDDNNTSNSSQTQSCHYEQMDCKVKEVKDQLDRLVLGDHQHKGGVDKVVTE